MARLGESDPDDAGAYKRLARRAGRHLRVITVAGLLLTPTATLLLNHWWGWAAGTNRSC